MAEQKYKRRILIVDTVFQYRLIRNIALLATLIVIFTLIFLAVVNVVYSDIQLNVKQPLPFPITAEVGFFERQAALLRLLWPVMLICIAVSLSIAFLFGIIVSHRMAGPIFRIRRVLSEMAKGDLRGDIHLRKHDDFKHLAESINALKRNWRALIQEQQSICSRLECGDDPGQSQLLNRLTEILAQFRIG